MISLLVEKIPSEDRKNSPSSRPPAERQSRWKSTVYIYDLDVIFTKMLLEDSLAAPSLGLLCGGESYEWKKEIIHH